MQRLQITLILQLLMAGMVLITSSLMAAAATVQIRAEDDNYITYVFIPSEVTISVGDTVTWKKGITTTLHSVFGNSTTKDYYGNTCPNGSLNGSLSQPDSEFSFTFKSPGDCYYQCLLHPPDMLGVIHVSARRPQSASSSMPTAGETP